MKITLLLDPASDEDHVLIAGTVFDLAVRVTHDDESPASNISLQWATFAPEPALESRSSQTDNDGVARNKVTAFSQSHGKPEPIFVQTPDGRIHLAGTVRCLSDKTVMLCAAAPDEAAPPLALGDSAPAGTAISGSAPYTLTIEYPGPNSILPADDEQIVYARLLDSSGAGVRGASIEVSTSARRIQYLELPVGTDAQGWATFWVRGVGLAEKAVDELRGTVTVKCSLQQYQSQDTKPLTFDTRAGGPGYFSLSLPALPGERTLPTPALVRATYQHRDGTPGKFLYLGISVESPEHGYTSAVAASPGGAYADDSGTALAYIVTKTQINARAIIGIDAGGGRLWYSEPYDILAGQYPVPPIHWIAPSMTGPIPTGSSRQLSIDVHENVSSSVNWTVEPRNAPVRLLPLGSMTAGTALADITGTSTSTAYKAYAAGVTGTYYQDGSWQLRVNAYSFYNGDAPPARALCGTITMSFPNDISLFSMKDWHTVHVLITKREPDGSLSPWPHRVVNWTSSVFPRTYKDAIFEVPYPSTTDKDGKCSIRVRADNPSTLMVDITASSPNPFGMPDDTIQRTVVFDSSIQPVGNQGVITIDDEPPMTPYVPHTLTARYTDVTLTHPFKHKQIIWSAFPSGQFEFGPNPSVTDVNGETKVTITAVGHDYLGPVYVYARAYNESTELLDIGSLSSLRFLQGTPSGNSAHIALRPQDGDLISDPLVHLVEATYRSGEGDPLAGQPIHWTVDRPDRIAFSTGPMSATMTDSNGVAVAAFVCRPGPFVIATVTAKATNPKTQAVDSSTMVVAIKSGSLVPLEMLGHIALSPTIRPPYQKDASIPLEATYTNPDGSPSPDQEIYWAAEPGGHVDFGWPSPTETTANGDSHNTIVCSTDSHVGSFIVSASSPNYFTGSYDFGQTDMSFVDPQGQPSLLGIMIDKPYARNPPIGTSIVDPNKPDQVITGQIVLTGPGHGQQDIAITTDPDDAGVVMFGGDHSPLHKQGTQFVVTTNAEGVAVFKAGALNLELISLQAATTVEQLSTEQARLSIALVDDSLSTNYLPDIQREGKFDPMPGNVPTFQARLEPGLVLGTDLVSVILNDVVVYYGPASHFLSGIDIAYALLNTTKAGNTMSYLTLSGTSALERKTRPFNARGVAQTGPLPDQGTAIRTLRKPGILAPVPIGPKDIVAGLSVMIPAYKDVAVGDVITLFFYLAGKYSLTAAHINNVATLSHTVTPGDRLRQGKPLTLVLPQVYATGYGAGTLQVDYRVDSGSGPRPMQWSQVTGPISINTTFG